MPPLLLLSKQLCLLYSCFECRVELPSLRLRLLLCLCLKFRSLGCHSCLCLPLLLVYINVSRLCLFRNSSCSSGSSSHYLLPLDSRHY